MKLDYGQKAGMGYVDHKVCDTEQAGGVSLTIPLWVFFSPLWMPVKDATQHPILLTT